MKLSLKGNIPFTKHICLFRIYRHYGLEDAVVGIDSFIDKSEKLHFFMVDYDDKLTLKELKEELKGIIKRHKFGDLEIYESSYNHYIVFGFHERITYKELLAITYDLNCCNNWKKWRMVRECGTLRLTTKAGYKIRPRRVAIVKGVSKILHKDNREKREGIYKWLIV